MTPEQRESLGLQPHQIALGNLLAVDPGFLHPAGAVFRKGKLVAAARVRLPSSISKLDDGDRARRIAALVVAWARHHALAFGALVFELPQIYRRERAASKGNPANMIKLALVAGAISSLVAAPVLSPTPGEWTMGLSKNEDGDPWDSPRARLLSSRLTVDERARVESTHDALDAAALGLHALGRFGRWA